MHLLQQRKLIRRIAIAIATIALSLLGAAAAVTAWGPRTYQWEAFTIKAGIHLSRHGQTRLLLPPLGTIRAATHRAPLSLDLTLTSLSLDKIQALAKKSPSKSALEDSLTRAARKDIGAFLWLQIGFGALGGLLAPILLRPRRARYWLIGPLIGAGAVAILLYATYRTYKVSALRSPAYTGSLRQAPAMLGLARTAFDNAQELSTRLRGVAGDLNTLYGRITAAANLSPGGPTVRILQITDIHNNGLAVSFVQELASQFKVDAVINTGDLTDFGLPIENHLSKGLAQIPQPMLFLAGNHDSQATVRAESAEPHTTVLDGQEVTVAGLTVLGEPDPSSARAGIGSVDTSDAALAKAAKRLAADVGKLPTPPDIVCVHNPKQAADVIGKVPLVLCGHTHTALLQTIDGTVVCNAGTTGGAGTRYFKKPGGVPLTAAILTFTQGAHPRLLTIDQVSLAGSLGNFTLTRHGYPPSSIPTQSKGPNLTGSAP